MGHKKKYLIRALGGGLDEGGDPTDIPDDAMVQLENFFPFMARLKSRSGLAKLTQAEAWDENINSMFAYKTQAGTWKLVVGGQTKIGWLDGDNIADIGNFGADYDTDTAPFSWNQYVDMVYLCRSSSGSLQRTNAIAVGEAGISAPTVAPTLTDNVAAGDLATGAYYGVYTYRNSVTGAESNPSPVSAVCNLGGAGNRLIDWTAVAASTNPQVNQRRVYRTLVDQEGEYYDLGDIDDNLTTTFTDNVLQKDMGPQASFDNGLPPLTCALLEIWGERAWVTDGIDLFFSELGLPESFSEYSIISVKPDDGHAIRGLLGFGDMILVGKTNAMYYVVGTDESDFDLRVLSDRHGCKSAASLKTAEGYTWWFGGDNFYMTDGNDVKAIGDTNVIATVASIVSSDYTLVTGAVDPTNSWYIAGVPTNGSGAVDTLLIYNYRTEKWTTFTYGGTAPQHLADFYDTSYAPLLYASLGTGHVYRWNVGLTDDGTAITAVLKTKWYGFEREDILKLVKSVALHTNNIAESVDLALFIDGVEVDTATIDTLINTRPWTRINMTNNTGLGAYVQLKLTYAGDQVLELKGIAFEIVDTGRRDVMG